MDGTAGGSTRDRLGLWLGAALVLASVLVLQALGGYAFHVVAAIRILCAVTIGALLLAWGLASIARPAFRPQTVLAGPLVIAMLAFGVSVLGSQRPRLSLEPALIGVASGLTLLMLTALLRNVTVRRIVAVMVLLLPVVVSVLYVGAVLIEWIRLWAFIGRFTAPSLRPAGIDLSLGSPNLVATYLILFAPLSSVIAARRFGLRFAPVVLGLAAVAILLTGSRGGYLGVAAAGLVALVMGRGAIVETVRSVVMRPAGGRLWLALSVMAAAMVSLAILVGPSLLTRISLTGLGTRSWLWRSSMELFATSPVTGTGPGTWAQLKVATALPTEVNIVVPHVHSLIFQTISEVGLLGTAGVLLFGVAVIWRSRIVHRQADRWTRVEVMAALAALVGLVAQQVPDYLMNLPAVALGAGLLIAWIDGAGERSAPMGSIARRSMSLAGPAAIVLGAILVVALPTLTRVANAMVLAGRASATAAAGDWSAALAGYERAVADDPDFTLYQLERASALAHLGRLREARDAYAPAVEVDLLPENVLGLAAIEFALGNPTRASELAHVALPRGWRNPTVALNAGRIFEATGDVATAVEAYAMAIYADPALASSAYWDAADRVVRKADVARAARAAALDAGDSARAALIAAYAGLIDEARSDVAMIPDAVRRRRYTALVEGIGGDRGAAIQIWREFVAASPGDSYALIWLARLLREVGDPAAKAYSERALHWQEVPRLVREEDPPPIDEFSVVPAIDEERSLAAWPKYPFGVYSRLGPPDLWPPQLLTIGVTEPS